jgi:DNA-binding IclR family transcriptional regulator
MGKSSRASAGKTPSVPSVERGLAVLELLATTRKGLTVPELSRRLSLPKSSTHALILTLERCGYLHRNAASGRYSFGFKIFNLANMALTAVNVRTQAAPFLRELMQDTRLTVHMAVVEQYHVVLVDKVEPPGLLRLATWIGQRMDMHCTAVGKALMAHLPDEEFEKYLATQPRPRYNENTLVSSRKLREQRDLIRRLGYSSEDEEGEVGFCCIGAPVFDHAGKIAAAISVAAPTGQMMREQSAALIAKVKDTAANISQTLGHRLTVSTLPTPLSAAAGTETGDRMPGQPSRAGESGAASRSRRRSATRSS